MNSGTWNDGVTSSVYYVVLSSGVDRADIGIHDSVPPVARAKWEAVNNKPAGDFWYVAYRLADGNVEYVYLPRDLTLDEAKAAAMLLYGANQ